MKKERGWNWLSMAINRRRWFERDLQIPRSDRQMGVRMNEGKSARNKRQILVISMRNRHTHGMRFPGRPLYVTIQPFQERGCSNIPVTIYPECIVFLSLFVYLRIYGHVKSAVTRVADKCVSSTVSHLSTDIP